MHRIQESTLALSLTVAVLAFGISACSDKSSDSETVRPDTPKTPPSQVSTEPIPGVDISGLKPNKQSRFYQLVASLPSPCGKAHSLRTSATQDKSCKRTRFALQYVVEGLRDEASDKELQEAYNRRYKQVPKIKFALDNSIPHQGPPDAPVQLNEFYDYACPACKSFAPVLDEVIANMQDQIVVYYRQFPLSQHKHSKSAAKAAIAAGNQGKFKEMHALLFQNAPRHERAQLDQYAQSLGLDMAKFAADFNAAELRVAADVKDGMGAKVRSTPSLYINGRLYDGPRRPKYLQMWIEEEIEASR